MLEKMPRGLGHALRGVRAGYEKIIAEDAAFAQIPDSITLESPAFADGGDLPAPARRPIPPTGHGPRLYAFQIFALDRKLDFDHPPGRKAVVNAAPTSASDHAGASQRQLRRLVGRRGGGD